MTGAEAVDERTAGDTITFARQMELTRDPDVPGRYHVEVSPAWNCPIVPQGGVMSALAARSMTCELGSGNGSGNGSGQRLRSITTVFAAPVPAGPVVIDVSVLRRGKSLSQATAAVRSADTPEGAVGHTSVGVFGRERAGFAFTDVVMPTVPGPDECPSFRDPPPPDVPVRGEPFPFWSKVEGRPASGHAPWEEYVPTVSDHAAWHRFDDPPLLADGRLDPLALVALSDTMPSSVSERMGLVEVPWLPPSADLTVHLLGSPRSDWVLAHKRARWAGDGYASVEVALWDPDPAIGLVAHACQVMLIIFPDGPPPPDERIPVDLRP